MIAFAHAGRVAILPAIQGDPFDRLLVVQADAEDLTLVTADTQLSRYEIEILPA